MSTRNPNEPRREYTEGEQQRSFIGRRMDAFADRSREPGDAATWAVVLGALMWTLLVISYSVARQPLMAVVMFVLTLVWVIVMSRFGNVNVFSILWGAATTDASTPPNGPVIFQASALLAVLSIIAVAVDAVTGWDFGWYGIVLLITAGAYVAVYARTWFTLGR